MLFITFHILYLSYTFHVIDTLFLVLVYLSYTFLFHILYCPYIFHILYFSYTVILYFTSYSYNCLYFHRIAVLCFSYHVIYTCHFLLGFMFANTLEADTGNNCMYPKVLSLYETVISICIYPKVSSLYETVTSICMTQTGPL